MLDLLNAYSVQDILVFIVMLALATRGVVSFFDWAKARVKKTFNKEQEETTNDENVNKAIQNNTDSINKIIELQESIQDRLDKIDIAIKELTDSDRDNIKSWIVEKHHYFCYEKGYIDDYSLDTIEKRYVRYKAEGGNSYVECLMEEVRELPRQSMFK